MTKTTEVCYRCHRTQNHTNGICNGCGTHAIMDSLTSYVHDAIIELGIESIGRDTKWEIADHTQLEPHQVQHGLDCGAMDRVFANEAEDDDYQYPELGEEKVYDHQCGDM